MKRKILLARALVFLFGLTGALSARGGCGAAFCVLNTHWENQGAWSGDGARLDLRYEYVDQDQPRAGRDKVSVGDVPRHHDEVRTLNRNLILALDYTLNPDWDISALVPYVQRRHRHIHHHHGAKIEESWDIARLGDVRVLGRYRLAANAGEMITSTGMIAGLKLATGATDAANADGDRAEPTLQPGTGTTDLIAGIYSHATLPLGSTLAHRFVQTQVQYPLNVRGGYRPGNQLSLDLGLAYPLTGAWEAMFQINTLIKDRDRGPAAEPIDSGGGFVWLSPGLSYTVTRDSRIYGFVQLPIYQRVNGVQLTAGGSAVIGASARF